MSCQIIRLSLTSRLNCVQPILSLVTSLNSWADPGGFHQLPGYIPVFFFIGFFLPSQNQLSRHCEVTHTCTCSLDMHGNISKRLISILNFAPMVRHCMLQFIPCECACVHTSVRILRNVDNWNFSHMCSLPLFRLLSLIIGFSNLSYSAHIMCPKWLQFRD